MLDQIDHDGDQVTVTLKGKLDGSTALGLRDDLLAVAAGSGDVRIDLRRVSFIDGSGVAALAFLFKRLAAAGRRLTVQAVGQPLALLRELGLAAPLGLAPATRRATLLPRLRWAFAD